MLRIEITADPRIQMDGGPALRAQVDQAMDALGFARQAALMMKPVREAYLVDADNLSGMTTDTTDEPAAEVVTEPNKAEQAEPEKPKRTRRTKAEIDAEKAQAEAPQISANPEARVDPADAAQDAADEQAETAQEPAKSLTLDDVRKVLGQYVQKFGMDRAQADGPAIMTAAVGAPTKKVTDIPDDPAVIQKVIAAIQEKLEA